MGSHKRKELPFAMAPFPEEYPGNAIWFTLRFVGDAPLEPPILPSDDFGWHVPRQTKWVDGASLAVGDVLPDGPIVGQSQVAGAPCWKIDIGKRSFRYLPLSSVRDEKVERVVQTQTRDAQLEYDGAPEAFDVEALHRVLIRIHDKHPLVAVLFQEGNWVDGEPLIGLDDAALVARLNP